MTPDLAALRAAHLTAALRALEAAEADLRRANKQLSAMRVGAILRELK
jgi:hypothetical protein